METYKQNPKQHHTFFFEHGKSGSKALAVPVSTTASDYGPAQVFSNGFGMRVWPSTAKWKELPGNGNPQTGRCKMSRNSLHWLHLRSRGRTKWAQ